MPKIRAVLLDAGNVFVTFLERTEVLARIAQAVGAPKIPTPDGLVAVKLLVGEHDGSHEGPYGWMDTGTVRRHAIWNKFLQATGLNTAQMPEYRFWALYGRHLEPIPAVAKILEELHAAGIPLVVVSNGDFGSRHAADLVAFHFAVRWTGVVVSSEIGCKKPRRAIFETAIAHARRVLPDLCDEHLLFIDDQARYVEAFQFHFPHARGIRFDGSRQPASILRQELRELGLPIRPQ